MNFNHLSNHYSKIIIIGELFHVNISLKWTYGSFGKARVAALAVFYLFFSEIIMPNLISMRHSYHT